MSVSRLGHVFFGACLLAALALAMPARADERILSYHSDITISADATIEVTETIRVRAEGNKIRRGIYRDFPTDYKDRLGNHYVTAFEVLGVQRDGRNEAWHTENRSNGVRVYIGRRDVMLDPGEYSYTIRYCTDRQIGYFDDHDELYWNVTGNGWQFRIDQASATVRLPEPVPATELVIEGYTGRFESSEQSVHGEVGDGQAHIRATRPLRAGEGLTLVLSWPKGVVAEPTATERLNLVLAHNRGLLLALLTLGVVSLYLYFAWSRHGRDPESGVIIAHYEPPEGYSPASARYVSKMGYDSKTLAAAVVNLAVKRQLTIDMSDGDYYLERTASADRSTEPMAPGEAVLLEKLFAEGGRIELDDANHKVIGAARGAHRKALKRDYYNSYFRHNSGWLLPSIIGSVLMAILVGVLDAFTPMAIVLFVLVLVVHFVFVFLLKAPTRAGRKLLDRLDGFELYLKVAEKDDLELRHPPDMTPELFERYLPFAIALGVEQQWADKFAQVFARLQAAPGQSYHPGWYHGPFNAASVGSFTSEVSGGFASAISSAATPPGSSSGSGGGGGGFSGGGGGGGGGGGW